MHVADVPCFWETTEYLKEPRLGPSYLKMYPMKLGTVTKGIGRERNLVSTMICSAIKIIFDYHHGNLVGPRSPRNASPCTYCSSITSKRDSNPETAMTFSSQHDSQEFLQYMLEGIHNEMNRSEQPPPKKKEAAKKPEVKKEAEVEQNGNGNGCPDEKPEVNGDDDNGKVTSALL